jgi:hypothetical protein
MGEVGGAEFRYDFDGQDEVTYQITDGSDCSRPGARIGWVSGARRFEKGKVMHFLNLN